MKPTRRQILAGGTLVGALALTKAQAQAEETTYKFEDGYPVSGTAEKAYDASDLRRAIEAYKFFYPTISTEAIIQEIVTAGTKPNEATIVMAAGPRQVLPTPNSDTPYSFGVLDLKAAGPMVIELPEGPFIGLMSDHNCRWVMDMGRNGPDKGQGGKHVVLPPDYKGEVPEGYFVGRSKTWKTVFTIRSMPLDGDADKAIKAVNGIKIYPLAKAGQPVTHHFIDVSGKAAPSPLLAWEGTLEYWRQLHAEIDAETAPEDFRPMLGMLAQLGIAKGKPFNPDARMKRILEEATRTALDELKVIGYANRSPERKVWKDRKWEWTPLRPMNTETKDYGTPSFLDLSASEDWNFLAWGASASMGRREVGAGSIYFASFRDKSCAYLDGAKTYKLNVPGPVPGTLFWSATIYDVDTRAMIATDQDKAAIRSLYEKPKPNADGSFDLYFGPKAPAGKEGQWIKTIRGKGWFTFFRIYGPEAPAFDGTWKLNDFDEVK